MSPLNSTEPIRLNPIAITAVFFIITIIISSQVSSVESSVLMGKIVKRAAYSGSESSDANSYRKSTDKDNDGPCEDTGVIITRPCSYEECLESKYPYVGVCRRWDETEWSEKVKICFVVVDTPCKRK